MPLDIVFQRYLQRVNLPRFFSDKTKFNKIISAKDDYIRHRDYYMSLYNPKWTVFPSIAFIQGQGPVVMTCRDHDEGDSKFYLYPPDQPNHILAPECADQSAHCVVQSRLIKPMKRTQYCTQYQLHEQRGTFNGIDTFGLTDHRRFNFTSRLIGESESRAIVNRSDVHSLITQLAEEKVYGHCIANSKIEEAREMTQGIDFKALLSGSTYVPMDVAMNMISDKKENEIVAVADNEEEREYNKKFRKYWPSNIYPCQTFNSFGARFPVVPRFNIRSCETDLFPKTASISIWIISCLMAKIEFFWSAVSKVRMRTSRWHGWLLVKLTDMCFSNISSRQDRKDPYKKHMISSVSDTLTRCDIVGPDFTDYLSLVDGVIWFSNSTFENFDQVDTDNDIIILYDYIYNDEFSEYIEVHSQMYELRLICCTWESGDNWDGFCYSRHGGKHFPDWWYQERKDTLCKQASLPETFDREKPLILAFVRIREPSINDARAEYLKYIGGQNHVQCHIHRKPLISSMKKEYKCNCGKKEYLRCCDFGCKCCICKKCFESLNDEQLFICENDGNAQGADDDTLHEEEDFVDELEEPHALPEFDDDINDKENGTLRENDYIIDHDSDDDESFHDNYEHPNPYEKEFENYLTRADDPDVDVFGDDDDNELEFDIFPATDASEIPLTIREELPKNKIHISGHIIFNKCGTLLTRKKHQINPYNTQKFFLQKIISRSAGKSVPLLYPEAMLFTGIFTKMLARIALF